MLLLNIAAAISITLLFLVIATIFFKKRNKTKRAAWEKSIYKQVAKDLENNRKRYNLWEIAKKESNGLEDVCKSLYITYCVQSIIGEHEILDTVKV